MTKRIHMKIRHLIIGTLVVLPVIAGSCNHRQQPSEHQRIDTLATMITQVQQCSRLYTSEIKLHKIVSYQDTAALQGKFLGKNFKVSLPASQRHIVIPIDATVKAAVDFSKFSNANIKRDGDKLTIILPDPELILTSTQIDHQEVREHVQLFRSSFTDAEITRIQQQGRNDILKTLPRLNLLETARLNAAHQIIPIFEKMGYKESDITVTFRKDLGSGNYGGLIKHID